MRAHLDELIDSAEFTRRHTAPTDDDRRHMLAVIGEESLDSLLSHTVPDTIRLADALDLDEPRSPQSVLDDLRHLASQNVPRTSLIGMGYYGTITPPVIVRNVLESPAWYTAYTPYQPEISQGRLEALLNFQTMVAELTGFDLANASLLDEATAAAEATATAAEHPAAAAAFPFLDIVAGAAIAKAHELSSSGAAMHNLQSRLQRAHLHIPADGARGACNGRS